MISLMRLLDYLLNCLGWVVVVGLVWTAVWEFTGIMDPGTRTLQR